MTKNSRKNTSKWLKTRKKPSSFGKFSKKNEEEMWRVDQKYMKYIEKAKKLNEFWEVLNDDDDDYDEYDSTTTHRWIARLSSPPSPAL